MLGWLLRAVYGPSRVEDSVYRPPLSEKRDRRSGDTFRADIVLIHGLGGDPWGTWSSSRRLQDYWPSWLEDDLPEVRVLIVRYPTHVVSVSSTPKLPIEERARILLNDLFNFGVGKRPWVAIVHSMGGIMLKALVIQDSDSKKPVLVEALQGVLFVATPHEGSHVANLASVVPALPGEDVRYLKRSETWKELTTLHEHFLAAVGRLRASTQGRPKLKGMYETLETRGFTIVPRWSALRGMDNQENDPWATIGGNHFTCCRPKNRSDSFYQRVLSWIEESLPPRKKEEGRRNEASDRHQDPKLEPLHIKPPPNRRFRVLMWMILMLVVLTGLAGARRDSLLRWWHGRPIRTATVQFRLAHSPLTTWDSNRFAPQSVPLTLGQVLVVADASLSRLIACLSTTNSETRRTCSGLVFVQAPGGSGKGPASRHIAGTVSDAMRIDLAAPYATPSSDDFSLLGSIREPYAQIAGVVAADLPKPDLEAIPVGSDGTKFRGLLKYYAHDSQEVPVSLRVAVVDSFDEISESARSEVVRHAVRWLNNSSDRTVIIFGRPEAARPYVQRADESERRGQILSLEPIYVGEGEALIWYLADVACYRRNHSMELHVDLPAEYCSKDNPHRWAVLRSWSKQVLDTADLPESVRELLYAGEFANLVLEQVLTGQGEVRVERIVQQVFSRASRHGRPIPNDQLYPAYVEKIVQLAKTSEPDTDGILRFRKSSMSVPSGPAGDEVESDTIRSLLDYSGLVEAPARETLLYRYYPPALQGALLCMPESERGGSEFERCYRETFSLSEAVGINSWITRVLSWIR